MCDTRLGYAIERSRAEQRSNASTAIASVLLACTWVLYGVEVWATAVSRPHEPLSVLRYNTVACAGIGGIFGAYATFSRRTSRRWIAVLLGIACVISLVLLTWVLTQASYDT